jgi:hypothetical protein
MSQSQKQDDDGREDFYRKFILSWEDKRKLDPLLVWDGSFRWFRSDNVIPLERYRSLEEMTHIRSTILHWQ